MTRYSVIGLPLADPAVQLKSTLPSCGLPETADRSGASGLSVTETLMVPVTSRSLAWVASRTVTITLFVLAPMSKAALMDTTPSGEQSTVNFAFLSETQPVTVKGVSGNGLKASDSILTCLTDPALMVIALSPRRANGLVDEVTRTVKPALTVPFA